MKTYFVLRYRDMISASYAEDITLQMMMDTIFTTSLLMICCPWSGLFLKKKWPPAWLRYFVSDKYEALMWIARIMSYFLYRMTVSGCLAQ